MHQPFVGSVFFKKFYFLSTDACVMHTLRESAINDAIDNCKGEMWFQTMYESLLQRTGSISFRQ